ncbi:class I SAM-dependent methyltransferase [Pedobacter sp. N23S346]|uniref:class I SAM-dependent methyltransferase n=1 Tax=Pedobacter sp. N23S346 TaxID=3402750 RepID=UPI003AD3DE0F
MEKSIDLKENSAPTQNFKRSKRQKTKSEILPAQQNINFKTIEELKLSAHSFILEIGFENKKHLPALFQKAQGIGYYGINFSDSPTEEVSNQLLKTNDGYAKFGCAKEKEKLDFEDNFFDCCFIVNTIYFWNEPKLIFAEIYRVLRTGGIFSISYIEQKHGKDLPWTQADFNFYETNELKAFLRIAGFGSIEVKQMTEEIIIAPDGQKITRPFVYLTGKK